MKSASHLPTTLNVRRLLWLRTIAIPGPAVCMLLVGQIYDLGIQPVPLILIITVLAAINIGTFRRLKDARPFTEGEFFIQMLIDVAALTGILYFTGGASNPFAFFFLLPLMITATVLPRAHTWVLAIIAVGCYTLLMVVRRPVVEFIAGQGESIFDLHVIGMWLGFVLIAALIAHYVVGMGETLRERDRSLAEAREQALNDERVLALATLATGAAHELSTPLATMAVIVDDLASDLQQDDSQEFGERIDTLSAQIKRCKEALSIMSTSSGAIRADSAKRTYLGDFMQEVVDELCAIRPGAQIPIKLNGPTPGPVLIVERRLSQAFINILHNALDASPADVTVSATWDENHAQIRILDRGEGLDVKAAQEEKLGSTSKPDGLGVGLFISQAAIDQLGGEIRFRDRSEGGTEAIIELPISETK
jgi:two-component system sensor histidine kinase RegB